MTSVGSTHECSVRGRGSSHSPQYCVRVFVRAIIPSISKSSSLVDERPVRRFAFSLHGMSIELILPASASRLEVRAFFLFLSSGPCIPLLCPVRALCRSAGAFASLAPGSPRGTVAASHHLGASPRARAPPFSASHSRGQRTACCTRRSSAALAGRGADAGSACR